MAVRDGALRLFASFVKSEGFSVTQWTPSLVAELPSNESLEQCSVRMRHGRNKKDEGVLVLTYSIHPAALAETYFGRFFDAFASLLERNDYIKRSKRLQRRQQVRAQMAAEQSKVKRRTRRHDEDDDEHEHDDTASASDSGSYTGSYSGSYTDSYTGSYTGSSRSANAGSETSYSSSDECG